MKTPKKGKPELAPLNAYSGEYLETESRYLSEIKNNFGEPKYRKGRQKRLFAASNARHTKGGVQPFWPFYIVYLVVEL